MITGLSYWYGGQIRRYLEQIVKAFSGFQYKTGRRGSEDPVLRQVPCRMASRDRQIGHIMNNNSENVLLAVPLITVDMTGLVGNRGALQSPTHEDVQTVRERAVSGDQYTGEAGQSYQVTRLMARPFTATFQVDIWTSNMDQKHQLMEQILTVFYPSISIQNSENPIDWTAKTDLEIEDISWSSRSVPIGTENEIEIATITLKMDMWLSPPAKVERQTLIEQIVTNVRAGDVDGPVITQSVVTLGNHSILVDRGILTLLGEDHSPIAPSGDPYVWADLLSQYGAMEPTVSRIHLLSAIEGGHEIVGTIQAGDEPNELIWTIDLDTLPSNTQAPVKGVIDPRTTHTLNTLSSPVTGDRYLLMEDISPSAAWPEFTAKANDIIQWNGTQWVIAFASEGITVPHYVLNINSGRQLRLVNGEWIYTIDGLYRPGMWRVHL